MKRFACKKGKNAKTNTQRHDLFTSNEDVFLLMFSEVEQMFDYIQTINAASSLYIEIKYNNAKANTNDRREQSEMKMLH